MRLSKAMQLRAKKKVTKTSRAPMATSTGPKPQLSIHRGWALYAGPVKQNRSTGLFGRNIYVREFSLKSVRSTFK
jgi:hypothetical protein